MLESQTKQWDGIKNQEYERRWNRLDYSLFSVLLSCLSMVFYCVFMLLWTKKPLSKELYDICIKNEIQNDKTYNTIKRLLKIGADPNITHEYGITPLYRIIINYTTSKSHQTKYYKLVNLLLENGANPNIADKDGDTPLCRIISYYKPEYYELVNLLLQYKGNPNTVNHTIPRILFKAIYEYKISINKKPYYELVNLLLENGANPNVVYKDGDTPLCRIASYYQPEYYELVNLLLQYKADPNICDALEETPLHHLCMDFTSIELRPIALLIKNGCYTENIPEKFKDYIGKAIDCKTIITQYYSTPNTLKEDYVVKWSASVANNSGGTLLHALCKNCEIDEKIISLMKYLIEEHDILLNIKDKAGQYAFQYSNNAFDLFMKFLPEALPFCMALHRMKKDTNMTIITPPKPIIKMILNFVLESKYDGIQL